MLGVITCVLAVVCKAVQIFATIQEDAERWRIQGSGPGGPPLPLIFRPNFFDDRAFPHPPLPYLKDWIRHC